MFEKAGVQLAIGYDGDSATDVLNDVLIGMGAVPGESEPESGHWIQLSISDQDESWELFDHADEVRRKLAQPVDMIYHLTDRIVFHVADKVKSAHCLHAAAVVHDKNALVIPASSGSGKSTFTSWLAANGFEYLTDELIVINGQMIEGIARPIQIKSHGKHAVEELLVEPDSVIEGKIANAVLPQSLGATLAAAGQYQVKAIVFPKYDKEADFIFDEISSAEAGLNLMANHVNARNLEGHGFREMMETIRNTRCFSLEYGGFDKLPNDFEQQLKQILEQ